MATQNLQNLNYEQLRAVLFGPKLHQNFYDATAEYMADICATQSTQVANTSQELGYETDAQQAITNLTQTEVTQTNQLYAEEAALQPSSMPGWLNDVVMAFMFAISCVTCDPALIMLSGVALAMQASGAQQKLVQAACGNDSSKAAAFEAGLALGEAMICGGMSLVDSGAQVAEETAETAAQTTAKVTEKAAKTGLEKLAIFLKSTFSYLGQTLMQNNFWSDFFKGPCGMNSTDAMLLGMFVGMGFAIGTSFTAQENGLGKLISGKLTAKYGVSQTEKIMKSLSFIFNMGGIGFEIGAAALDIQIGEQYARLSDFHKDLMGPAMAKLTLLQNLLGGFNPIIATTQQTMSTVTDDAVMENQTFAALGTMFRSAS